MKNLIFTTAAMALAFSFPPFTAAQTSAQGPSSAAAEKDSTAKVYTDNSTKSKDSYNTKKIDVEKTLDSYNTKTKLDLTLKDSFNKTTVVVATKLDGYVSGNRIHDIGNTGGYATNSGNAGNGGDGGNAKAAAYSGKAAVNGGDGGYSKAGSGGDGGKGSIDQDAKNGYARNSEKGDGKAHQTAKPEAEARAKGADGGKGGRGGDGGAGGAGGAGGTATSGDATVKRTSGGDGGNGGDLRVRGGSAGTFNASNTLTNSFNNASGIPIFNQNTGMSSLQQVGVTVMATINNRPAVLP